MHPARGTVGRCEEMPSGLSTLVPYAEGRRAF